MGVKLECFSCTFETTWDLAKVQKNKGRLSHYSLTGSSGDHYLVFQIRCTKCPHEGYTDEIEPYLYFDNGGYVMLCPHHGRPQGIVCTNGSVVLHNPDYQ